MLKHLFPFMDADGAGSGLASEPDGANDAGQTDSSDQAESVQEGADELKTGTDVKSEAQQLADGIVRKRLKGLSKDELDTFKEHKEELIQYLDSKKTVAEKIAEAERKAAKALTTAEQKEAKANAMIAAARSGLKPEHVEDAVILAMARANDETTIEDAIIQVAQSNPSWKTGAKLPDTGSNPATGADEELSEIPRYF